jgi:hypothetical protein
LNGLLHEAVKHFTALGRSAADDGRTGTFDMSQ